MAWQMITPSDLDVFWQSIVGVDYVVLRNYDSLVDDLNCGGDIDILVSDRSKFLIASQAIALQHSEEVYNYAVSIGSISVPIDLRVIGDGYYDSTWEFDMLRNRVKSGNHYILDSEHYKYSILYHCIMHKRKFPQKYRSFANHNGIKNYRQLIKILDFYMQKNKYKYVIPKDKGVEFNKIMYFRRRIHELLFMFLS